jgi:hypothetical protein
MKARITKNDLKIKRLDYRYFENGEQKHVSEHLVPSKDTLEFLARKRKGSDTGWRVFPRYSVRVELLEDFRNDAGKARDKFIWGTTFNPNTDDLETFLKGLEKRLEKEKPETRSRIIKQVRSKIK